MALLGRKSKQAPQPKNQEAPHKIKHNNNRMIAAAAVVIIIIAIAYYAFFIYGGQAVVLAPATTNLTQSGEIFSINSAQYLISLSTVSLGSGKAYVHVSKLPVFVNPLLNVTLTLNNITKVNAGSTYADVGIQLLSASANSITIKVTPLSESLQIAPDSQYISVISGTLYNSGQSTSVQASTSTTIGATTTKGAGSTATTSSATTTVTVNTTAVNINAALKQNQLYGLLLNFSVLYTNTSKCTASLYNSTYLNVHGSLPKGSVSFANVSPFVPYNLSRVTKSTNGYYEAVFTAKTEDPSFNNSVAATITVNPTTKATVNQSITGVFQGLNYSQLSKNYVRALSVGGACAVDV